MNLSPRSKRKRRRYSGSIDPRYMPGPVPIPGFLFAVGVLVAVVLGISI